MKKRTSIFLALVRQSEGLRWFAFDEARTLGGVDWVADVGPEAAKRNLLDDWRARHGNPITVTTYSDIMTFAELAATIADLRMEPRFR